MNKLLKNKKVCIALLVLCVLALAGIVIWIAVKGNKDDAEAGKSNSGQEIIVHESDEDTVEEKVEGGLTESDSEDGPVLDEDKMIDFNAGEDNNADDSTGENPKEDEESRDTGSWGAFY